MLKLWENEYAENAPKEFVEFMGKINIEKLPKQEETEDVGSES